MPPLFHLVRDHFAFLSERVEHHNGLLAHQIERGDLRERCGPPLILEPSATGLYVNRICTSLPSSLRIA
jgi:hypothetical protein